MHEGWKGRRSADNACIGRMVGTLRAGAARTRMAEALTGVGGGFLTEKSEGLTG